ncbi:HepT-like ribonuclease domain-containing protein [Wenzhouxiangella sp. EGI_FJ10409]|uniref:HepT-like ribonuclease domain-containing protein n=1 Tax=Wenzhouxiangella sp. EGI_FJ10409 TaxID=3243767 RepID=UPI0035DD20A9
MRPEERDQAYAWDMLQAAEEIREMLGDRDVTAFLGSRMLMRAIERNLEIIGEAAGRLSPGFREAYSDIPWRQIIGQRNILAHEYGQIDHELLFRSASEDIPELVMRLRQIIPDQ